MHASLQARNQQLDKQAKAALQRRRDSSIAGRLPALEDYALCRLEATLSAKLKARQMDGLIWGPPPLHLRSGENRVDLACSLAGAKRGGTSASTLSQEAAEA